eukprot:GFUD01131141.1.p1 GENE.GFUD01131141.1~~GFUD01131141.1.p1  ORF type:complete len:100 (-),score=6.80 GFUD01131141.1:8-307(-)
MVETCSNCERCNKCVDFTEQVKVLGKVYHRLCFTCNECKKLLDPSLVGEDDSEMVCRSWYRKNFGPKGRKFGCGPDILSVDPRNGRKQKINFHKFCCFL